MERDGTLELLDKAMMQRAVKRSQKAGLHAIHRSFIQRKMAHTLINWMVRSRGDFKEDLLGRTLQVIRVTNCNFDARLLQLSL